MLLAKVNNKVMVQMFVVLELKKGPAGTTRDVLDEPTARLKHATVMIEPGEEVIAQKSMRSKK